VEKGKKIHYKTKKIQNKEGNNVIKAINEGKCGRTSERISVIIGLQNCNVLKEMK